MQPTSHAFPANARAGLGNATLQRALGLARTGFPARRAQAVARLPEFEALREEGRAIKDHTLAHLDFYLELYERNVMAAGGQVHWARNADEARDAVLDICRAVGAKIVTKGKSMVAEEIALNDHLEANGITPVETDLGEYIIQLRHEPPSHIIAPAIHLMKEQVADTFRAAHRDLDPRPPARRGPRDLCDEARTVLRPQFLAADVGITGANFLIAETGSSIIVTNEGNGDLTQTLPRVHIVITSIEKVVPTLEDAATLLRLLARSATGQEFSSYTTVSTGPRRPGDLDGPEQYHVVLLDNGRTELLGGEFQDMLRCLRCAACLNHCPVYAAVGGHAYGWVYPGPMGAVLTPALVGIARGRASAERLDLLRKMRERLPGQDPAAEDDAALARARICAAAEPAGLPLRACGYGHGWRRGRRFITLSPMSRAACSAGLGRRARTLSPSAARRGLDRGARHAGAGRPQLPEPVGRAATRRGAGRSWARATTYSAASAGALRRGPLPAETQAALAERVAAHRRNLIPARAAALDDAARIELFVAMAEEVQTTVARVASRGGDSGRGGALSGGRESAGRTGHGARSGARRDPVAGAAAAAHPPRARRTGRCGVADPVPRGDRRDRHADAGVGGRHADNAQFPARHAYRRAARRAGRRRLRGRLGPGARPGPEAIRQRWPRTVNLITGPSRTGDIEQRIQLGAHGPRRLHVVLVETGSSGAD